MMTFKPTKESYIKFKGQKVKLNGRAVTVTCHETKSKGGSWERGFRFYNSEWAMLKNAKGQVSFDHGKTWHDDSSFGRGRRLAFKASKGKMKLSSSNHGEFAFNGIQEINRKWEGPGYRWHR